MEVKRFQFYIFAFFSLALGGISNSHADSARFEFVHNSSFEDHSPTLSSNCPGNVIEGTPQYGGDWLGPSTEFLMECVNRNLPGGELPATPMGTLAAPPSDQPNRTYVGFGVYDLDQFEYLYQKLKKPLKKGIDYQVSYDLALAPLSRMAMESIDVAISKEPVYFQRNPKPLPRITHLTPQVRSKDSLSGSLKNGVWNKVKGSFIANGGEEFLYVGAFSNRISLGSPHQIAYYFLDQVSVQCVSIPKFEIMGAQKNSDGVHSACSSDAITLDPTSGKNMWVAHWVIEETDAFGNVLAGKDPILSFAGSTELQGFKPTSLIEIIPKNIPTSGKYFQIRLRSMCENIFEYTPPQRIFFPSSKIELDPIQDCTDPFPFHMTPNDPYQNFDHYQLSIRNELGEKWTANSNLPNQKITQDLTRYFDPKNIKKPGKYSVELHAVCKDQTSASLQSVTKFQHQAPAIQWTAPINLEVGEKGKFQALPQGPRALPEVSWNFDGVVKTGLSLEHTWDTPGSYPISIQWTHTLGCESHETRVTHVRQNQVFVPNAFTPNQDGKNDVFRPIGQDALILKFEIFDRWGQIVFSGSGLPLSLSELSENWGWDGGDSTAGAYVYQIEYVPMKDHAGGSRSLSGMVQLIR